MSHDRVVRVTAGTQGQGSGYLLTPRHALTARHVFGKRARVGQRCDLEPLVDSRGVALGSVLKGKLGWLPQDARLDLAIIVLDAPAPGISGAIELARVPTNSEDALAVNGTGFPLAVDEASHTMRGKVTLEPVEQILEFSVTSAQPKKDANWSGASGTVLLAQDRAVGVVATVDVQFTGRLSAVPVQRLLDAPGFSDWWSAQGQPALVMRAPLGAAESALEEIVAHIHWLDREQPFKQAQEHIKAAAESRQAQPRLIFVPGRAHDLHRHLIQRIAESERVQRMLGRLVAPQDLLIELPWPPVCQPTEDALGEWVTPLFNAAGLPPPPTAALGDAEALRDLAATLSDRSQPNAWWTQLNRAISGPGAGLLLQAIIDFWTRLPAERPLFLIVCLALDEAPAPSGNRLLSFLSRPKPPDTPLVEEVLQTAHDTLDPAQILFLDELEPIVAGHVTLWVNNTLARCRRSSAEQRALFEAALAQRIGPLGQPLEPIVAMLPTVFGSIARTP